MDATIGIEQMEQLCRQAATQAVSETRSPDTGLDTTLLVFKHMCVCLDVFYALVGVFTVQRILYRADRIAEEKTVYHMASSQPSPYRGGCFAALKDAVIEFIMIKEYDPAEHLPMAAPPAYSEQSGTGSR